jgi:membrane protease YdiL (CAAX protease family)
LPENPGSTGVPIPERPDREEAALSHEGPPPATWRALEALPVGLIAVLATALLGVVVAGFYPPTPSASVSKVDPRLFAITNVIFELSLVAAVLVWIRYVNRGRLSSLGPPREPWTDVAVGVAVGLAVEVLGFLALFLLQHVVALFIGHQPAQPEQVPATVTGWPLALTAASAILLAPLGEETFFRGFLYRGLRRRFSVWPAALISAFFFGLVHVQGASYLLLVPPLFVVGLGLALVYERRQSLLASMAAHATFNVIGVVSIVISRH